MSNLELAKSYFNSIQNNVAHERAMNTVLTDLKSFLNYKKNPLFFQKDGKVLRISIQAGAGMYSSPRENLKFMDQYDACEIAFLDSSGFLNEKNNDFIKSLIENIELSTGDGVCGYVPVQTIIEIIAFFLDNNFEYVSEIIDILE